MIYKFDFVNSSMLRDCSWNSETNELTVRFANDRSYTYVGVDKGTYDDLINAESAGKHFNSIKMGLVQK